MSGELVRVDHAQIKINRPDGSTIEYSGPPEELSIILSQLSKTDSVYPQLLQWATRLQKLQPLFVAAGFALLSVWVLLWATRPADNYYQPQSQGANYEQPA